MEYRRVGRSDLKISAIGFGCWTMGGLNFVDGAANGWADVDEDQIAEGIRIGLDAGVNHFDNADVYGNGRAERMLARVLRRLGVNSADLIIASKVGHFRGTAEHAYTPFNIRRQCEQSLINLEREYLDIYYFHHGDFGPGDCYLDDAVATINDLVDEGKVLVKGQSAYSDDDFLRVVPKVQPEVLQSRSNAMSEGVLRPDSPVVTLMEQRQMSFVAFSPLGKGLLLDKYDPDRMPEFQPGDNRAGRPEFQVEAVRRLKPKLALLKAHFGETTEDLAAMAMGFVLAHPCVAGVIPGFRNPAQARCNVAAAGRSLAPEEIALIREALS